MIPKQKGVLPAVAYLNQIWFTDSNISEDLWVKVPYYNFADFIASDYLDASTMFQTSNGTFMEYFLRSPQPKFVIVSVAREQ